MAKKSSGNALLSKAKRNKNDEFYTQLTDIEKELQYYSEHFKDKVVLCNCDDPRVSNFFKYFALKFKSLGLKRLITTCYKSQNPDLFSRDDSEQAVYFIYEGEIENIQTHDFEQIKPLPLRGDGDFRSEECIELLRQADIVVTNPPFSLFREYIAQLVEYDKKFIIIGNKNAVTYKEVFQMFQENKIWIGMRNMNQDIWFERPEDAPYEKIENGKKLTHIMGCWFTNLPHKKRNEDLILYKRYTPEAYPKYDNYDAINVDKTADIPEDYYEAMGVPITFLDKYNPNQFEILDANTIRSNPTTPSKPHGLIKDKDGSVNGQIKYARIVIRRKQQ